VGCDEDELLLTDVITGEFRLREAEERGDTDQIKRDDAFISSVTAKGVSFDQLRDFVEEVTRSCEKELKHVETSLIKTAKWHKIMLMSAGNSLSLSSWRCLLTQTQDWQLHSCCRR